MKLARGDATKTFGLLGLAGAVIFALSIVSLQIARPDVDWTRHYVSDFVNGPMGWLFVVGALLHGLGNLSLAIGLKRAMPRTGLFSFASGLFVAAAVGVLIAAVFPTDPANGTQTWIGFIHGSAVTASFALELATLLIVALTAPQVAAWKAHATAGRALTAAAVLGLGAFLVLRSTDQLPGLGERVALAAFMAWEIWVSIVLIRIGAHADPTAVSDSRNATAWP